MVLQQVFACHSLTRRQGVCEPTIERDRPPNVTPKPPTHPHSVPKGMQQQLPQ